MLGLFKTNAITNPNIKHPSVDIIAKIKVHANTGKNVSLKGPAKTSIKLEKPTKLISPFEN